MTKFLSQFACLKRLGDISGYAFLIHWVVIQYGLLLIEKIEISITLKYVLILIELIVTLMFSRLYGVLWERKIRNGKEH